MRIDEIRDGALVLAAVPGYPPWPSYIVSTGKLPKDFLECKPLGTSVPVIFINEPTYSWVKPHLVKELNSTMCTRYLRTHKKDRELILPKQLQLQSKRLLNELQDFRYNRRLERQKLLKSLFAAYQIAKENPGVDKYIQRHFPHMLDEIIIKEGQVTYARRDADNTGSSARAGADINGKINTYSDDNNNHEASQSINKDAIEGTKNLSKRNDIHRNASNTNIGSSPSDNNSGGKGCSIANKNENKKVVNIAGKLHIPQAIGILVESKLQSNVSPRVELKIDQQLGISNSINISPDNNAAAADDDDDSDIEFVEEKIVERKEIIQDRRHKLRRKITRQPTMTWDTFRSSQTLHIEEVDVYYDKGASEDSKTIIDDSDADFELTSKSVGSAARNIKGDDDEEFKETDAVEEEEDDIIPQAYSKRRRRSNGMLETRGRKKGIPNKKGKAKKKLKGVGRGRPKANVIDSREALRDKIRQAREEARQIYNDNDNINNDLPQSVIEDVLTDLHPISTYNKQSNPTSDVSDANDASDNDRAGDDNESSINDIGSRHNLQEGKEEVGGTISSEAELVATIDTDVGDGINQMEEDPISSSPEMDVDNLKAIEEIRNLKVNVSGNHTIAPNNLNLRNERHFRRLKKIKNNILLQEASATAATTTAGEEDYDHKMVIDIDLSGKEAAELAEAEAIATAARAVIESETAVAAAAATAVALSTAEAEAAEVNGVDGIEVNGINAVPTNSSVDITGNSKKELDPVNIPVNPQLLNMLDSHESPNQSFQKTNHENNNIVGNDNNESSQNHDLLHQYHSNSVSDSAKMINGIETEDEDRLKDREDSHKDLITSIIW